MSLNPLEHCLFRGVMRGEVDGSSMAKEVDAFAFGLKCFHPPKKLRLSIHLDGERLKIPRAGRSPDERCLPSLAHASFGEMEESRDTTEQVGR